MDCMTPFHTEKLIYSRQHSSVTTHKQKERKGKERNRVCGVDIASSIELALSLKALDGSVVLRR